MRGLFIGRFQPFHKGHLLIIKRMLDEVDELAIVVGSAQHLNTHANLFSADERAEMIRRALTAEGIGAVEIFKIHDINNDDLYPGHVMRQLPPIDVVYSGNSLVQRLFKEAGKEVRKIKLIKGEEYSGTEIRKRMKENQEWQNLVPEAVEEYLEEIKGVERVKKLGLTK